MLTPFLLLISTFLGTATTNAEPVTVLSFNIRYDNPDDKGNLWANRKDKVAQLIQFHQVDLIGIQEALHQQVKELEELLPEFSWVGVGRNDGKTKGEYVPIFYRKGRLELLDSGHFWLSETPYVPGSKSWDAAITRMVTYAKFKDLQTEKEFYHFNTHFDHKGEQARLNSAFLIHAKILKEAGEIMTIITGDFNTSEDSETYKVLTRGLFDTRTVAEVGGYGPAYTYKAFDKPGVDGNIIDYIFIKNYEAVRITRNGILNDNWNGKYPSDHLPVLAAFKWK